MMYKVVHVFSKDTNELVYIGIISSLEASIPLAALRANYNSLANKVTVSSETLLYNNALAKVGNELKEYFDKNGTYPCDNQKMFDKNYSASVQKLLQSFSNPFEIDEEVVLSYIEKGHQFGNYLYGHYSGNSFIVDYVGRCTDEELQDRIMHRWNKGDNNYVDFNNRKSNYVRFRYAESEQEAIDIECLLYHYFGGSQRLINNIHPSRKNGYCLVCDEVKYLINTK